MSSPNEAGLESFRCRDVHFHDHDKREEEQECVGRMCGHCWDQGGCDSKEWLTGDKLYLYAHFGPKDQVARQSAINPPGDGLSNNERVSEAEPSDPFAMLDDRAPTLHTESASPFVVQDSPDNSSSSVYEPSWPASSTTLVPQDDRRRPLRQQDSRRDTNEYCRHDVPADPRPGNNIGDQEDEETLKNTARLNQHYELDLNRCREHNALANEYGHRDNWPPSDKVRTATAHARLIKGKYGVPSEPCNRCRIRNLPCRVYNPDLDIPRRTDTCGECRFRSEKCSWDPHANDGTGKRKSTMSAHESERDTGRSVRTCAAPSRDQRSLQLQQESLGRFLGLGAKTGPSNTVHTEYDLPDAYSVFGEPSLATQQEFSTSWANSFRNLVVAHRRELENGTIHFEIIHAEMIENGFGSLASELCSTCKATGKMCRVYRELLHDDLNANGHDKSSCCECRRQNLDCDVGQNTYRQDPQNSMHRPLARRSKEKSQGQHMLRTRKKTAITISCEVNRSRESLEQRLAVQLSSTVAQHPPNLE